MRSDELSTGKTGARFFKGRPCKVQRIHIREHTTPQRPTADNARRREKWYGQVHRVVRLRNVNGFPCSSARHDQRQRVRPLFWPTSLHRQCIPDGRPQAPQRVSFKSMR